MKNRTEVRPCIQCGKEWPMRHRGIGKWGRFCGIACANLARGIDPVATRYRKLTRDGRKISEHRLVASAAFGRVLARNEVVHHRNGIKTDNRPENLEIKSASEHSREHMLGNQHARRALT